MKGTILVTGIGKRLGYALANTLLDRGYPVIGTFRTDYPSINVLRSKGADLHQVDFYHPQVVEAFIDNILLNTENLRAIIHNASDWMPDNANHSADVMRKMMTVHASVPYQINLALKPLLEHFQMPTDIIHISDYVAEKGSKKHIAYAASKAAMNSLTQSFAALLAPSVKVNSISPALVKFNDDDDYAYQQKALSKALLRKEAGFSEIINGIDFIMNSQFMTGRNLQLDGGRHLK